MKPRQRQLFVLFMVVVFVLASVLALAIAFGIRVDPRQWRLVRTGTLVLSATPSSVKVFVDGAFVRSRTPTTIRALVPGPHRITVEQEGYLPWSKTLTITAGRTIYATGIVLVRQQPTITVLARVPAAQVLTSLDKRFHAVRQADGQLVILERTGAEWARPNTPPLDELIAWSHHNRFLIARADNTLLVIEFTNPVTTHVMPAPPPQTRWIWNQQTETLAYALATNGTVIGYDLLTQTTQTLPFRAIDMMATGQTIRTIEATNLEQSSQQLVTRSAPSWEAVRRLPIEQSVVRFLGQRSDVLVLAQTAGLLVVRDEVARRWPLSEPPIGAEWSSRGELAFWTEHELWVADNERLENPQLIGRFSQMRPPVRWVQQGAALVYQNNQQLVLDEIDARGERYRAVLFGNDEASYSWVLDGQTVLGLAIRDGQLTMSQMIALPRAGAAR